MARTMFQVRKLSGQPLVAMSVSGHSLNRLFYTTDHSSGRKFLVDTELKSALSQRHRHDGFHLEACNSLPIATYGS